MVLVITAALGVIAVFTALKLYQLRQEAVAPTAPGKSNAASLAIIPLNFTIATGPTQAPTAKPTPTPTVKNTPTPTAILTTKPTTTSKPNKTENPTATPEPQATSLEELTPTSAQRSLFTDFRIFLPILTAIGSGIILIFISSTL